MDELGRWLNIYLYNSEGRVCAVQLPAYSGGTLGIDSIYDADGKLLGTYDVFYPVRQR